MKFDEIDGINLMTFARRARGHLRRDVRVANFARASRSTARARARARRGRATRIGDPYDRSAICPRSVREAFAKRPASYFRRNGVRAPRRRACSLRAAAAQK